MRIHIRLGIAIVLAIVTSRGAVRAQQYRVERIASGLRQPMFTTQAPGDPANIIYYMTRVTTGGENAAAGTHGSIFRYDMDTRVSTEVLNLSHRDLQLDLGPQGFAFHPDFNNIGTPGYQKFYVSSAVTGGPTNFVEEYAASGPGGTVPINGGTGEPIVNRMLLQYNNVTNQDNHVIDWIGFDPRAYAAAPGSPERNLLFVSTGDGSNGQTAPNRPEQKANSPQGKLLRIDVDPNKPDFYPADPLKNFAIPTTNPIPLWNAAHGPTQQLAGTRLNYASPSPPTVDYTPAVPEIYFTGTRNSFRMSQDRTTGDFYAGDVGENSREEINFLKADPYNGTQLPYDFGYPQREGTGLGASRSAGNTSVTWILSGGGTSATNSINPIQEIPHATFNASSTAGNVEIRSTSRSAMIGGYLYRGPIAELQGKYFYTDFVQGNIFALQFDRNTPLASYSGTNFNQVEIQPGIMAASLGTEEVVLNRNLNSLWHTIMVDPQDPTYTPALGQSFGIGRVVSFGEDNSGNLYIIDMGGVRGDAGFGNDYPAGAAGEIFRLTRTAGITATIDRDSGAVTVTNSSGAPLGIRGYTLASAAGSLNVAAATTITGHYDAPPGGGNGSVDPDNDWQVTSPGGSTLVLREASLGDEAVLSTGEQVSLSAGDAWQPSKYEDVTLHVTLADGSLALGTVAFVGHGGLPFGRSDFDGNDLINLADWHQFITYHGTDLAGLTLFEQFHRGDINGDGDNDFDDFRLFQTDYDAAHGVGALVAALAEIPEPASASLLLLAAAAGLTRRRRGTPFAPLGRHAHRRPA